MFSMKNLFTMMSVYGAVVAEGSKVTGIHSMLILAMPLACSDVSRFSVPFDIMDHR